MPVQLILTEEMIDCFHSCAKRGDYQKLFNDYPGFFIVLVENLKKVEFPDDSIWQVIAKNSESLLDILKLWHTGSPLFSDEMLAMGEQFPEFISHFWDFDSVKNWNNFYTKYNSTADIMITCARNEGVLDFKIECKGIIFDYFEKRDKFLEHGQKLKNELMSEIREVLKLSEAKIEEDGKKLRNELMESMESLEQHMENRISETNDKIESLNRKLAHFNTSFNEKFNSLGEQFNLVQLDKKIEALSIKSNSGEDLNQFLAKIGDKFNEQQIEMNRRADWMSMKMEKMIEMMIRTAADVGPASPGPAAVQDSTIGTSQDVRAPESNPTDNVVQSTDQKEQQKREEKSQEMYNVQLPSEVHYALKTMTVTIIITEEMIQCFNQCARIGEYQQFLQEHYAALQTIIQHLKSASFPKELVCTFVSMHLKECMQYLTDADSKAAIFLLRRAPALYEHMRYSIYQGNWNSFYWDYRSKLDYMIEKARNQKVINFQIEFQSAFFESFKSRDMAGNYKKPDGRCLPEFYLPTPILTHAKNVCKVEPVQKEKLKEFDTNPTDPEVAAIEASGTNGQFSRSAGPTRMSLTTANSAAVAADIMNSVTETQIKNEQLIRLFESELDPDKSDRMKMRELKNMIKDLKSDFNDHKNQVEQKLTEQTTQIQNLENSFKDEIDQLKLAIDSRDEQSNKRMDQPMNMMAMMMQNSSNVQTSAEKVNPAQNLEPDPFAPRTQESSSGTSPIPPPLISFDVENCSFTSSGIFSMSSSDNSHVGSYSAVPTGNLIDLDSNTACNPEKIEEDKEIRQLKEDFEIKLAEQKRLHDIELQEAEERRREINREAEAERELRFGKLIDRPVNNKQE